jgi:hypothetical protein
MKNTLRYLAQALLYVPLMAILGYFSTSPQYTHMLPDEALLRLSFSHAGQRLGECRERTPEELAKLAPNMRSATVCPRERAPVTVELEMDGKLLYRVVAPPSGLSRDGASTVYRRLPVEAGKHHFVARMRDKAEGEYNYVKDVTVQLAPGRVLVIDFLAGQGGWLFKT